MAALFHPEGSVADPVDSPAHVGTAAITAFFDSTFTDGMQATLSLTGPVRIAGRHAAFPMQVAVDLGEQTGLVDIVDTMEFDEEGRILVMRAYWDMAAMHFE